MGRATGKIRSGAGWSEGGRRVEGGEFRIGSDQPRVWCDTRGAWKGGGRSADFKCGDAFAVIGGRGVGRVRRAGVVTACMVGRNVLRHAVAIGLTFGGDGFLLRQLRAMSGSSFQLTGESDRHGQRQHDAGERLEHAPKIGAEAGSVNAAG